MGFINQLITGGHHPVVFWVCMCKCNFETIPKIPLNGGLKWRVKRSWTWSRLGWPTHNLNTLWKKPLHTALSPGPINVAGTWILFIELVILLLAIIASSCWSYRLNPRRFKIEYTKVLQSAILLLELHISLASPRFFRETSISAHMYFIFLVG